jgi:eukaryotic-like serine/threonine-protein kinase
VLRKREEQAKAAQAGEDTSSQTASAPAPAPLATPAERAELAHARQRMVQLASRAEAINQSIRNLEQQQAKQGVGLRGDMAAARASMEYLMGETKASIDAKDFDAANQSMDLAEPQIEKLEKFLGR